MSGLVSYSYDPGSDQEVMSDSPHSHQEFRDRKDDKESRRRSEPERERRREMDIYEGEGRERESKERHRDREHVPRRDRDERSPHRSRRSHKHHSRRHRDSSTDSDSSERHHGGHGRARSPRHRSDDRIHSDRSYRRHRDHTPPRTITSAPTLHGNPRPSLQYWPGSAAQLTPEEKLEMALTAMKSGNLVPTGNPLGMSTEKFRDLQSKKKRLWSKDEDEKTTVSKTENVYLAATSSMPLDQEKKEKFSKLMGLKSTEVQPPTLELEQHQYEKTQQDLQQQYDQSRVHTHLMKGSGLGYGNYYQV